MAVTKCSSTVGGGQILPEKRGRGGDREAVGRKRKSRKESFSFCLSLFCSPSVFKIKVFVACCAPRVEPLHSWAPCTMPGRRRSGGKRTRFRRAGLLAGELRATTDGGCGTALSLALPTLPPPPPPPPTPLPPPPPPLPTSHSNTSPLLSTSVTTGRGSVGPS